MVSSSQGNSVYANRLRAVHPGALSIACRDSVGIIALSFLNFVLRESGYLGYFLPFTIYGPQ